MALITICGSECHESIDRVMRLLHHDLLAIDDVEALRWGLYTLATQVVDNTILETYIGNLVDSGCCIVVVVEAIET